jgi:hypothetical protein
MLRNLLLDRMKVEGVVGFVVDRSSGPQLSG